MVRKLLTAALVLVIGVSAVGCGAGNAGTSAYRWDQQGTTAQEDQSSAGGTMKDSADGTYNAGSDGRVQDHDSTDNSLKQAGEDLMNNGKNMARDAKNAAENVGGTTKSALENASSPMQK